jgi:hypothetical protein
MCNKKNVFTLFNKNIDLRNMILKLLLFIGLALDIVFRFVVEYIVVA